MIKIEIEIDYDVIENILVTALEGGSNYWYMINGIIPGDRSIPGAQRLAKLVHEDPNFRLPIHDVESDEFLGYISQSAFTHGISLIIDSEDKACLFNILSENYDAGDADIVLQYIVMGEVVYG